MAELTAVRSTHKKTEPRLVTEFSGKMRSIENFGLEKGDQFIIPYNYEIREEDLNGNSTYFIKVSLLNGTVKHFYPAILRKCKLVFNEDGTSTGKRVATDGTAAELFQKYRTMRQGLDALRGKVLQITDIKFVRTIRYGTTSLMLTQIPTIDIVR